MAKCPHPETTEFARRFPCVPCEACQAHVDGDGNTMTAAVALERFPQNAGNINANEARWHAVDTAAVATSQRRRVVRSDYRSRKEYRFAKKIESRRIQKKVLATFVVVLVLVVPFLLLGHAVTGTWLGAVFIVLGIYIVAGIAVLVKVRDEYPGDDFWLMLWNEWKSESPQDPSE